MMFSKLVAVHSIRKYSPVLLGAIIHIFSIAPLVYYSNLSQPSLNFCCVVYFVIFGFFLHALESVFYFEKGHAIKSRQWAFGIIVFTSIGILASVILPQRIEGTINLWESISEMYVAHSTRTLLHIAYSSISFMVIYSIIGSITWPFIKQYYTGPDAKLSLKVPSGKVVISLQLFRGVLATISIIPLIIGLGELASEIKVWGYLILTMGATFAIMPMIMAPQDWPLKLRIIHGVEILVFVILQSFS